MAKFVFKTLKAAFEHVRKFKSLSIENQRPEASSSSTSQANTIANQDTNDSPHAYMLSEPEYIRTFGWWSD